MWQDTPKSIFLEITFNLIRLGVIILFHLLKNHVQKWRKEYAYTTKKQHLSKTKDIFVASGETNLH